jgi:hypothetical protein
MDRQAELDAVKRKFVAATRKRQAEHQAKLNALHAEARAASCLHPGSGSVSCKLTALTASHKHLGMAVCMSLP